MPSSTARAARAAGAAAPRAASGRATGSLSSCRNRIAFFELLFACAKLGAILVPLNWRMPAAELDRPDRRLRAERCCSTTPRMPAAARARRPAAAIDLDEDYEALLADGAPAGAARHWPADGDLVPALHVGDDRPAQGRDLHLPDGARQLRQHRHRRSTSVADRHDRRLPALLPHRRDQPPRAADADRRRPGDRCSTASTPMRSSACSRRGGSTPSSPCRPSTRRCSIIRASPPRRSDRVRHWGCGGAPLPDALAERCRDLGIRVCNGMGMTETGPTAFLLDPADAWDRIGSVGKPQLLCSARIVDEDGRDVPRRRGRRPAVRRARGDARLLAQRGGDPRRLHRRRLAPLRRPRPARRRRLLSMSPGGGRRCSSRAARMSIRPRSRTCSAAHPGGRRRRRAGRRPTRTGARSAAPSSSCRRSAPRRRRTSSPPSAAQRLAAYKVPQALRVRRRFPAHLGGQDPEASARPDGCGRNEPAEAPAQARRRASAGPCLLRLIDF